MENINIKQGLTFYANLDKDSQKEIRSQIENLVGKKYTIDFEAPDAKEDVKVYIDAFNKIFSKGGISINWENLLMKPAKEAFEDLTNIVRNQFSDVWESVAKNVGNINIGKNNINSNLAQLNKEKKTLEDEIKALEKRETLLKRGYVAANYGTDDDAFERDISKQEKKANGLENSAKRIHAYQFKSNSKNIPDLERKIAALSGSSSQSDIAERSKLMAELEEAVADISNEVQTTQNDLMDLTAEIEKMLVDGKSGDEYDELVYRAMDKLASLYEMRESLSNSKDNKLNSIAQRMLKFEDIESLTWLQDEYTVGEETLSSLQDVINAMLQRIGARKGVSADIQASLSDRTSRLKEIETELVNIESQANNTKASLKDVEDALKEKNRLNNDGSVKKTQIKQAQEAIDGKIKTDKDHSVKAYYEAYENSKGQDFVERYKALLNFVNAYNQYTQGLSEEEKTSDRIVKNYQQNFEELSQHINIARESLELFISEAEKANVPKRSSNAPKNQKPHKDTSPSERDYTTGDILGNPLFANMFKGSRDKNVDKANQSLSEQKNILTDITKLTDYVDENYLSAGQHLSDFLDRLQNDSSDLDDDLKEILTTLHLIDENGNLTFTIKRNGEEGGGTTHNGALISDDFVLIERDNYEAVKNSKLPEGTQKASDAGLNVAKVLGYNPSKYNSGFFDIQTTAKGNNLFKNGMLSEDVVNASIEQLLQLADAFVTAREYGFDIENGGSNIVYDKERGFSFYDLEEMSNEDQDWWSNLSELEKKSVALENVFSLFSGLNRDNFNYEIDPNQNNFVQRLKESLTNSTQFKGINVEEIFGEVFEDSMIDSNEIIAMLKNESESHTQNTMQLMVESEDQETLEAENGTLEQRLELLRDIAEQYGNTLTQKGRDRYEELEQKDMDTGLTSKEEDRYYELGEQIDSADEALEEFGSTYDKILLKLANGKNVEILPDDKGLRTLNTFADGYGDEYNGVEIEDVQFIRAKKEEIANIAKEQLETEHLLAQEQEKQGQIIEENKAQAEEQARIEAQRVEEERKIAEENARLEAERKAEEEARREAEKKALVDENTALQNDLTQANQEVEKLRQELANKDANIDNNTHVFNPQSNDVEQGPWALESTLNNTIKPILDQIQTNTVTTDGTLNDEVINRLIEAIRTIAENQPETSTNGKNNPYLITDDTGNLITVYRGTHDSFSGMSSNRIGTFGLDKLSIAKGYTHGNGKVYAYNVEMHNPLEIVGNKKTPSKELEYLGNPWDRENNPIVKELYELVQQLKALKEKQLTSKGFEKEVEIPSQIRKTKERIAEISADESHPYGVGGTDLFARKAKNSSYDGVIFRNIVDPSAHRDNKGEMEQSNIYVVFDEQQMKLIETLAYGANGQSDTSSVEVVNNEPQTELSDNNFNGPWARDDTLNNVIKPILEQIQNNTKVSENENSEITLSDEIINKLTEAIGRITEKQAEMSIDNQNNISPAEVSNNETQMESSDNNFDAPWAREDTLNTTIKGALDQIQINTAKISDPNTQQIDWNRLATEINKINTQKSNTSKPWALENTLKQTTNGLLGKIVTNTDNTKSTVKSINDKIVKGTFTPKNNNAPSGSAKPSTGGNGTKNTNTGTQFRDELILKASAEMEKFLAQIKATGITLTDAQRNLAQSLVHDLGSNPKTGEPLKLINGEAIKLWNLQLQRLKTETGVAKIEDSANDKVLNLYKKLGALGVEKNSLDANSDERKGIVAKIALLEQKIQQKKQLATLTSEQINTARQLGAEENRADIQQKSGKKSDSETARQKEIHDAQVEAEVIKQLVELYRQLGEAQARGDINETTRIRADIKTQRGNLSSIDYATDMKFKDAKEKSFASEKAKKENETLKEQKKIVDDLTADYKELGILKEKADLSLGTNLRQQYEDEVKDKERDILSKRQQLASKIGSGDLSGFETQFKQAQDIGKQEEDNRQYRALAKKVDSDEESRKKKILSLEKEIGKLRADQDNAANNKVKDALEDEIRLREQLIELQKQGLEMDAETEAYQKKRLSLNTSQSKKDAAADVRDAQKAFNDSIKESREAARMGKANSAFKSGTDALYSTWRMEDLSDNDISQLDGVQKLRQSLSELDAVRDRINQKGGLVEAEDAKELQVLTQEVVRQTEAVNGLISNYERFNDENSKSLGKKLVGSDAKQELIDAANAMHNGQIQVKSYNETTQELTYTVKTGAHEFTDFTAGVRQGDKALREIQGTTKRTESFLDAIKRKTKEISTYLLGSASIGRVISELRKGITYVREIDSALTELKKVTDETEETYDRFLKTAGETAGRVGSTIKEVVSSTADWARLGYTLEEASKLAESTQILLNVSEFSSVDDASKALISSLQAFNVEADKSMTIVDKMNEIGNRYAISSDGIATALQDSASSLYAANNSLEESIALTAAANRVVQDPNSVGSALRTISLRLRGKIDALLYSDI